ncbi:galactose-1-phosphate uridylyltransferase [Pseudovibrio japonicus]|uniref:Galactose-1-phosphate uridylyltransferase n=1 Tax=Pseudovibrio japonicus TaxID=366534 RepID=A0ABQ3EKC3_9HYPH|nr:UDP-glucose--hexose-1-phosphate uridylyltransferase [Pseudovibrio japonicus]GHB43692.1 galactose-1-phosphate uridylyltransferase [Pseudovibrio japonicus]
MNYHNKNASPELPESHLAGFGKPHRRFNALTGEWVLVSPQRGQRPWKGAVEQPPQSEVPKHDEGCYLCAGNTRINGVTNPDYCGPYVFPNDFPALLPDGDLESFPSDELLRAEAVNGEARVICYSERHDLSMPRLSKSSIRQVVDCWKTQYDELSKKYEWVAIFENKGAAMGCSNPHPHGQIWASDSVPTTVSLEDKHQKEYLVKTGRNLLDDYAQRELKSGERVVFSTEHWLCVVPFWATWPFETLLLPLTHTARLSDLSPEQSEDLAGALQRLTVQYDNLFETEFPYSMGWHGAPCHQEDTSHWRLHAHFYPPLLRSATVKKFMVGYELLADAQRDITPEIAAERLRDQSKVHYLEKAVKQK